MLKTRGKSYIFTKNHFKSIIFEVIFIYIFIDLFVKIRQIRNYYKTFQK